MNILMMYFLFLGLFGQQPIESHAVYISVSNITLLTEEKMIKVSIKVFSDDLEDAIQSFSGERIGIRGRQELTPVLKLLESYMLSKTEIAINGKNVVLEVVGGENNGDSTWIHFSGSLSENHLESINVKNQIFTELFDTQTNVVEVDMNGEKYFLKLTKNHFQDKINLKK